MILWRGKPARFFLIRSTFPLVFLAVFLLTPERHWIVFGFLLINLVDVLGGIIQFLWKSDLVDYRFAAVRDVLYAAGFYVTVVSNPHIPALILAPSTLAELFILFGYRVFYKAILIEIVLLIIRMTIMREVHHLIHPAWAIFIVTASVIMGLLGFEITRLEELRENITRQQEQLKETLTEMVKATLTPSGFDENVLNQQHINSMLHELCQDACQSKGRELGLRLAHVLAMKQSASSLLTSRELEVLTLVAADETYRQIAEHLQVSPGTIRAHVASLMRKADVHSRTELVGWACQNQLLCTTQSDIENATG